VLLEKWLLEFLKHVYKRGPSKNFCIDQFVTAALFSSFYLLLAFEKESTIERFLSYGKCSSTNYQETFYICAG
jgi:hypothetical protein